MAASQVLSVAANSKQVVVFRVADEEFAVGIESVREIIPMTNITTIPRTPSYVRGVLDLRGSVIPVIDLRDRFDLGALEDSSSQRICVVEMAGQVVGMIVDDVEEVLTLSGEAIQPPPATAMSVDSEYLLGVARHNGRLLILLDLDRVLSVEQQAAVAAAKPLPELGPSTN